MHVLFANTGVQIVCIPLRGGSRYQTSQIGYGWQRTAIAATGPNEPPRTFPYIQWQIIQSGTTRLFLAVDTSCGDPEVGYFCSANSLTRDFLIMLQGLLDIDGKPLKGVPDIELCIRPAAATAGEAKQVHMIIDFGNSRTGVLLLELAGEISQTPQMLPFELTNRYHLDAWNEEGEPVSQPAARWFSSKSHWCNTPYLPPLQRKKTDYHTVSEDEAKRGWFGRGGKTKQAKVEVVVTPPMFDDISMVRMGREADDVVQVMRAEGDIRTGVSSPKRYLWADDSSWLEGANWHMADPTDRCKTSAYSSPLKGPFLKYMHEDDRDFLLQDGEPKETEYAAEAPLKPRHAPRVLMTSAALRAIGTGLYLRQFARLSAFLRRGGPGARNPHAHAQQSQRHDPGRAPPLCRPGQQGNQHLLCHVGQEPALQAGTELGNRRSVSLPFDLHLERIADAGPGPAAVVRSRCGRTAGRRSPRWKKCRK